MAEPKTLYDFFTSKGQALPSLDKRFDNADFAQAAQRAGITKDIYTGSADQNNTVLSSLLGAAQTRTTPAENTNPQASAYASQASDALTSAAGSPTTPKQDQYGVEQYKTARDTASQKKQEAFDALKGFETKTYQEEYDKSGLKEKKDRIASIDAQIATKKKELADKAASVSANPELSAATQTGEIAKFTRKVNADIANLVAERNSAAQEYNTGLDDIDKTVERALKDKQLEYGYWEGEEGAANDSLLAYQKLIEDALKEETQQSNFEKQLAQALEIARMRDTTNPSLQLITDTYGDPTGYFNRATGEVTPYTDSTEGDTAGGPALVDTTEGDQSQAEDQPGFFQSLWNRITRFRQK